MVAYNGDVSKLLDFLSCLTLNPLAEMDLFRRRLPILVGLNVFGSLTGDDGKGKDDEWHRYRVVAVSFVVVLQHKCVSDSTMQAYQRSLRYYYCLYY